MLHRIQNKILKTGDRNVVAGNYVGTLHSIYIPVHSDYLY
jgi:hypothetical protein